jgi:hypothetical protein
MSGALFREPDKKSERSPDYTGSHLIAGTKYRLAGWIKEGKRGKYLNISATSSKPKEEQHASPDCPPARCTMTHSGEIWRDVPSVPTECS